MKKVARKPRNSSSSHFKSFVPDSFIDHEQLDTLCAGLESRVAAAYDVFFAEAAERVARIKNWLQAADHRAIAEESHALKSAAATFACRIVSQIAERLEANAASTPIATLEAEADALSRQLAIAHRFFAQYFVATRREPICADLKSVTAA